MVAVAPPHRCRGRVARRTAGAHPAVLGPRRHHVPGRRRQHADRSGGAGPGRRRRARSGRGRRCCAWRATSCARRWRRPRPASARPRQSWPACAAPGAPRYGPAVAQADSVLIAAQAELQRTQDLVAKGFVSQARLDEAQRAVAVAQAQLAGARAQSAANADAGTDVAQAQAQLALARSTTAAARARLDQTAADRTGRCARARAPGRTRPDRAARAGAAEPGPGRAACSSWRRSTSATWSSCRSARSPAWWPTPFPTRRFAARVQSIAPLVDAQRGAIEVKFSLPQHAPAFLREDMTLSVEVRDRAPRARRWSVPVAALRGEASATTATVLAGARRPRRAAHGATGPAHARCRRGAATA